MSIISRFTTLDDAYYFLNQVRGLPEVPNTLLLRQRMIRSSMILSWVALEEIVESVVDEKGYASEKDFPKPPKLFQVIEYAAKKNGKPLDLAELTEARRLRNDVVHARSDAIQIAALTEENCRLVFDSCLAASRAVWPFRIECSI
jgi:hypothetical protein